MSKLGPFQFTVYISASIIFLNVLLINPIFLYFVNDIEVAKVILLKEAIFLICTFTILYILSSMYYKRTREVAKDDLKQMIQNLQNYVFRIKKDDKGRFIYTFSEGKIADERGRTTENIYGLTSEEASGKVWADQVDPYYEQAFEGTTVSYEVVSEGCHLFTTLSPIYENGKVVEIVGASSDITEIKQMEENLKRSHDRIHDILEGMAEGFLAIKSNGDVTYINSRGAKLLHCKKQDLIGQQVYDIFPPEIISEFEEAYQKSVQYGERLKKETSYKKRWFEVTLYPSHEGCSVFFSDVTERKHSQALLQKSEKLSAVGQLAAGVAHEIRNPLTSLRGFIQLLQKENRLQPHQHYVNIMISELDRIELIISEFLVLAKPQAVHYHQADICTMIEHTMTLLETQAHMNNVAINVDIDTNIPRIVCEPNQLKQVFINILKNAIEAMPDGGEVQLNVYREDEWIKIICRDEGIGIQEKDLQNLGDPFFTTKDDGTGLGLTVSFRIIENHGGRIEVNSQKGKGTTFTITLPLTPPEVSETAG